MHSFKIPQTVPPPRPSAKEFRVYARQDNVQFVRGAIRAFGRVANAIPEVADACLNGQTPFLQASHVHPPSAPASPLRKHRRGGGGCLELSPKSSFNNEGAVIFFLRQVHLCFFLEVNFCLRKFRKTRTLFIPRQLFPCIEGLHTISSG